MQSSCTPCTDLLHAHTCILDRYIDICSHYLHVGFCCCCFSCCSLLLTLETDDAPSTCLRILLRACVLFIIRRYSGSTSSSRRWWWLVVAGGGGQCGVRLYCIILYNHNMYMYIHVCVCGVGLGGRASELQRTSGGHRIKCALRNRVHFVITTTTWWEGACLSVRRLPAALVAAGGCVCGTRHVFRPVHL